MMFEAINYFFKKIIKIKILPVNEEKYTRP